MMTLINCTVAGNTAITTGGGIGNSGNPAASQLHRRGRTRSPERPALAAGSTSTPGRSSRFTTRSSRAISTAAGPNTVPSDIFKIGAFVLDTQSTYNLIGTGGAGDVPAFTQHNLLGVDPRLGPLQDNGGPTQTMALLDGSPAFDAGNNALVPAGLTTDQRGLPRVFDGTVDIGAFESQTVLAGPSLVVNTTLDDLTVGDNKTTLLEAIILTNNKLGGGTITFDPAVFPADGSATIQVVNDLAHGTLVISSDVTIVGPGAKALTVQRGRDRRRTSACSRWPCRSDGSDLGPDHRGRK